MYTMKPRRSRSRAKAVVMDELGEPAMTVQKPSASAPCKAALYHVPTTSVLAPPLDLRALRFLRWAFLCINSSTAPVPTKAAIPALIAVFFETHRCTLCQ